MAQFTDVDKKKVEQKESAKWPHPEAIGGREWGPFYDYQFVTTEFGEVGVPSKKVLYYKMTDMLDPTTRQRTRLAMPYYRDALETEIEEATKTHYEQLYEMGEVSRAKMEELGYRKAEH
jgi:hypothetical protein